MTQNKLYQAAERAVNLLLNRPDGFEATAVSTYRYYSGDGGAYLYIDDCIEVEEVAVKESPDDTTYTVWNSTDWQAFAGDPRRPDFQVKK